MKKRYEIRDTSKGLGYFDSEEEVEDFFFKKGKKVFTKDEISAIWIVSDGRRGWWAIGAEDYLNKRGSLYAPYSPEFPAEKGMEMESKRA